MYDEGLEQVLARTEQDVDAALKTATSALGQIKKARTAAQTGSLKDLEKSVSAASQLTGALVEALRVVAGSSDFNYSAHFESGAFLDELREEARDRGLAIHEQDGYIFSYPCLLQVQAAETAVSLDRKLERRIRPSYLVGKLKVEQTKTPRFNAQRFTEGLFKTYMQLIPERDGKKAHGPTVKLLDIYTTWTLRPGSVSEYSRQEFARDIYLLDQSGAMTTKQGLKLDLPAASGTKGAGTISTVTKEGRQKRYYGIAFW